MLPLRHRSTVNIVGKLDVQHALQDETPLFAADGDFARAHGGPITAAFLATLPPREPVIVDTSLVWLTPGLTHGLELAPAGGRPMAQRNPPRFLHEPFPCVTTGVRGVSNRNQQAVHRLCVLGLACTPEIAEGDFTFDDANAAETFWLPTGDVDARDREIEQRLESGALTRRMLSVGDIVEFGWGTLMRTRPAQTGGFQYILRATMHDARPAVNGKRNLTMV